MKLKRNRRISEKESTIPLINVVFLMLIFFLIAGTIAPVTDVVIDPILTSIEKQVPPEEAISIRRDGTLLFRGQIIDTSEEMPKELTEMKVLIVYPDKETDAALFLDIAIKLHQLTQRSVTMLVERAGS